MKAILLPDGFHLERLRREHPRNRFSCGEPAVDRWLSAHALQQQSKHLSVTNVLLDDLGAIAGYYTLASGQVDFNDLPAEVTNRLPRRDLPVAVLAWLGVDVKFQSRGLGERLLAAGLRDCWTAGNTFPFVAVILDCIHDRAKDFYVKWGFAELPGHPLRLFLGAHHLQQLIQAQ